MFGILWYVWAMSRAAKLPHRNYWFTGLTLFFALMLGQYVVLRLSRYNGFTIAMPQFILALAYLWHMLALPVLMMGIVCFEIAMWIDKRRSLQKGKFASEESFTGPLATGRLNESLGAVATEASVEPARKDILDTGMSRRQFLVSTAIIVPPTITSIATGYGLTEINDFRIQNVDIKLAGLPKGLHGLKIAQVTDVHAGQFTGKRMLQKIADATNRLDSDLVLMTGDLIDYHLKELPGALNMVKSFESRYGTFMCQGNHDLFMSREDFDGETLASGVKLLVNDTESLEINGEILQLLGLKWGDESVVGHGGAYIAENVGVLKPQLRKDAFPILLAHHPHAFDAAVDLGIPLTLAGHTHGGQLMLAPGFGPASYMYKYISGYYEKGNHKLFVSNGTGNWFPLRVNAPAEIVVLTLKPEGEEV